MSDILRRLFGRNRALEGDLATGDWTPIPATAMARPEDLVSWLSEDIRARKPVPKTGLTPTPNAFTPEELAIIQEQQACRRVPAILVLDPPRQEPTVGPDLASIEPETRSEAPRATWIDVLKAYAEHLTDAELTILRQQFQS